MSHGYELTMSGYYCTSTTFLSLEPTGACRSVGGVLSESCKEAGSERRKRETERVRVGREECGM